MPDQRKAEGAGRVTVLGAFVADLSFRAARLPAPGETVIGSAFACGPGGKGSNQAIAAARAGAAVSFISRIGTDSFGDMAMAAWTADGVRPVVRRARGAQTGAAFIHVDEATGENAILVVPGAAAGLSVEDVDCAAPAIRDADVFVTQLEQPVAAAVRGLQIARAAGVTTIFNPAPATALPEQIYGLCDFIVPNETETEGLTGVTVRTLEDAWAAATILVERGARTALITLGARGALLHGAAGSAHVPPVRLGETIDTTGAGDAFVGGFAAAYALERDAARAARFGAVVAGLAVTRSGTAPAMPRLDEINQHLAMAGD